MIYNPRFYAKALVGSLEGVSPKEHGAIIGRFAEMLARHKALGLTRPIYAAIETELAAEKKKNTARIVTAAPLSSAQQEKTKKQFPAKIYEFSVNQELLGGMVVQHGTKLYQMTLKRALNNIQKL